MQVRGLQRGDRFEVGHHQNGPAVRQKNAGEVSWSGNTLSHSHFSHLQPPRENARQRRRSHGVPILKYLHLAPKCSRWASLLLDLLSPSLSKSDPLAQTLGHCLGLLVWLHSCLFLTPLQIQRRFFSYCPIARVSVETTESCSCGLAPLHRCTESNDIIVWFVQHIVVPRESFWYMSQHLTIRVKTHTHGSLSWGGSHKFEKEWLTIDKGLIYSFIRGTANMGR